MPASGPERLSLSFLRPVMTYRFRSGPGVERLLARPREDQRLVRLRSDRESAAFPARLQASAGS